MHGPVWNRPGHGVTGEPNTVTTVKTHSGRYKTLAPGEGMPAGSKVFETLLVDA